MFGKCSKPENEIQGWMLPTSPPNQGVTEISLSWGDGIMWLFLMHSQLLAFICTFDECIANLYLFSFSSPSWWVCKDLYIFSYNLIKYAAWIPSLCSGQKKTYYYLFSTGRRQNYKSCHTRIVKFHTLGPPFSSEYLKWTMQRHLS
jgi:hypothetical protein